MEVGRLEIWPEWVGAQDISCLESLGMFLFFLFFLLSFFFPVITKLLYLGK